MVVRPRKGHHNGGRKPPCFSPIEKGKGGGMMVTYEALQTMILFASLIIAIITLILAIFRKD